MKRVNWKLLYSQIPPRVQIGKRTVEIVWIKGFNDGEQVGETRLEHNSPFQIVLRMDEPIQETVKTYLHELAHAVSGEEDIGLTEKQVQKIEKAMLYLLKPNNVFEVKK